MKKRKILYVLVSLILLVGCSNNSADKNINNNNNNNINNNNNSGTNSIENNEKLKEPVLEWCQLYNPNGFDTITCIVTNPNKVDIDITYDLVFYKDGKEVSRQEEWFNFQISSKHNDVIWGNVDIPKTIDVDEVKMENITVTKSYYESIDAEIKYVETKDDEVYFSVKHDKKPTISNISFLLYNDDNKNGKCDKEELVVVDMQSTTEKEDKVSFASDVYDYTNYEIYYNAY